MSQVVSPEEQMNTVLTSVFLGARWRVTAYPPHMFPVISHSESTAAHPDARKGFNENIYKKSLELDTRVSTPYPEPDFNTKPEFLYFYLTHLFSIYE